MATSRVPVDSRALAELLAKVREIEELMADFGAVSRKPLPIARICAGSARTKAPSISRSLPSPTPASICGPNARGVPLWKLLLDLTARANRALLDLSYLEDVLTPESAIRLIEHQLARPRRSRKHPASQAIPATTPPSAGSSTTTSSSAKTRKRADSRLPRVEAQSRLAATASRDIRRAAMLRELAGPDCQFMFDANQQWTLPKPRYVCHALCAD